MCCWFGPSPPYTGPPSAGPPKISLFLFPFPPHFRSFCLSLGCLLVEFWWCLFVAWPSNVHVWALGLSCETPRALGPPGLHTTTRELQTCTFESPGLRKHHQNSTRRHPERETKRAKMEAGEREKKSEILGPPIFGAPKFRARFSLGLGPTLRSSLFGPPRSRPDLLGPAFWPHHDTHTSIHGLAKIGLAKIGLAKLGFGQNWPGKNQDGQKWIGQN